MKPSDIVIGQKYYRINEDDDKIIYLGIGQKEDIKNSQGCVIAAKDIKKNLIIFESKQFPRSVGRIVLRPGHKDALKGFWDTIQELED